MHNFLILIRLLKSSNNQIPKSIFDKLPHKASLNTQRNPTPSAALGKIPKDHRLGPIRIDWMDIEPAQEKPRTGKEKALDYPKGPAIATFSETSTITSGSTSLSEGTIHLFRTNETNSTLKEDLENGTVLAVLAIPSWMTVSDFLTFISAATEGFAHLRIVRDASPNRAIALIKFRTKQDANDFQEEFNGRFFNSMEPEICHVVRVTVVKIETPDLATGNFPTPSDGTLELPTCPVCLERMDTAITGLVTVPCSHTFHCQCLSKWGDSRCPVCRYSQKAILGASQSSLSRARSSSVVSPNPAMTSCTDCSTTTNLWICLICGNVGCGRYGRAHAHAHYQLTTHLYALELETQRVWDYAGDAYVHRLIQNRTDGKLVELPSASITTGGVADGSRGLGPGPADTMAAEKVEAIGIEYSYLLTSQLDSQRAYYEEQLDELKVKLGDSYAKLEIREKEAVNMESGLRQSNQKWTEELDRRMAEASKDRARIEKKAEKALELARKFEKELKEEKMVNEGLMQNLVVVKKQNEGFEQQKAEFLGRIEELEDQMRDLMFYVEARDKVEKAEGVDGELAGGSLEVQPPKVPASRKKRGKK